MAVRTVELLFTGNASQAAREMEKLATGATAAGTSMHEGLSKVGGAALLGIAAGAAIVGTASVKMAGDFQAGILTLVTGAGEAKSNIKLISDGILQMAVDTGTSTKQLTDGMFMIESAGFHGADGLKVLQAAAEGAKVGNADLGVTANAVTTVLKDYHMSAGQAADATNFLVTVVSQGKTHMEDLAGAISQILPVASSLNIPLADVGGALATLTSHGIDADRAATMLRFSIGSMVAPSAGAVDALNSIGLSATDLGTTLTTKGLTAAFQQLEDHLHTKFPNGGADMIAAMSKILGGVRGMGAGLGLTGQNLADFTAATKKTADTIEGAHGKVLGFNEVQKDFNFKLDQAKEVVQTLGIKLGTVLIPVVEDVANALMDAFNWLDKNRGAAEALGIAVGTVLAGAIAIFVYDKVAAFVGGIQRMIGGLVSLATQFTGTAAVVETESAAMATSMAGTTTIFDSTALSAGGLGAAGGEAGVGLEAAGAGGAAAAVGVGSFVLPVGLAVGAAAALTIGLRALIGSSNDFGVKVSDLATVSVPALSNRIAGLNTTLAPTGGIFWDTSNKVQAAKEQTNEFNQVLDKTPQFAQKYIDAAKEAGVNTDGWSAKLLQHKIAAEESRVATERWGLQAQIADAQAKGDTATVEALTAQLNALPTNPQIELALTGADAAAQQLQALLSYLNAIVQQQWTAVVNVVGASVGAGSGQNAFGGA